MINRTHLFASLSDRCCFAPRTPRAPYVILGTMAGQIRLDHSYWADSILADLAYSGSWPCAGRSAAGRFGFRRTVAPGAPDTHS